MADIEVYAPAEKQSEIFQRPEQTLRIRGQAGFFSLVTSLGIPVLTTSTNAQMTVTASDLGSGVSFSVASSSQDFQTNTSYGFVNVISPRWFGDDSDQSPVALSKYAMKKIVTSRESSVDDAQHLAYMVNEVRILSNLSLRRSENIVKFLFISWHEMTSRQRFWPQIILERADQGTLSDYLASHGIGFIAKACICLDIVSGLNFLHAHRVVHADLKPANILMFDASGGQRQICAKLSDFGSSVVTTDYPRDKLFSARLGTPLWASPEMEMAHPIQLDDLFSTDIYSLGLVISSVTMGGKLPFGDLNENQISELKAEDCAVHTIMKNMITYFQNETQKFFIYLIVSQTVRVDIHARLNLEHVCALITLALVVESGLYGKCLIERPEDISNFHEVGPEKEGADATEEHVSSVIEQILRSFSVKIRKQVTDTVLKRERSIARAICQSTASGNSNLLQRELIEREPFRNIKYNDIESATGITKLEMHDQDNRQPVPIVPDFAHSELFRPSSLPKVAAIEILKDLISQADSTSDACAEAAFQLAAVYLNGSLTDRDNKVGLRYLTRAARIEHKEALRVALNIFRACEKDPPHDLRQLCLSHIQSEGSKAVQHYFPDRLLRLDFRTPFDRRSFLRDELARSCRCQFRDLISSPSQRLGMFNSCLMYLLLEKSVKARKKRKRLFNLFRLNHFDMPAEGLAITNYDAFIAEVKSTDCLNEPTTLTFTLLQLAVLARDLILIERLILDLGADVNEAGVTPGWTPFYLSCLMGCFDIAKFLSKKGALVTAQDEDHGSTVLHLLTQFNSKTNIEQIAKWALEAGMDVNHPTSNGMTPLHAAFVAFDFSQGAAVSVLLSLGANPTLQVTDGFYFVTPIGLCARKLDVHLLKRFIRAARELGEDQRLAAAKPQAFHCLCSMTPLFYISVLGEKAEQRFFLIVEQLVDQGTLDEMRQNPMIFDPDGTILNPACHRPNDMLLKSLLRLDFVSALWKIDIDHIELLRLSIERRSRECSRLLIHRGADITKIGSNGHNALHSAALLFPDFIPELASHLENLSVLLESRMSSKDVLQQRDRDGLDVFGILVREAYSDDLKIAESLRQTYNLDYDSNFLYKNNERETLTAYLVRQIAWGVTIPIENVQYLLNISPAPRFTCGDKKQTLLSLAVAGPRSHSMSRDQPGHRLTKMILKKYPEASNIALGHENRSALFHATLWTNRLAIQYMKDHVRSLRPPQTLPHNVTDNGVTVLDAASSVLKGSNAVHSKFVSEKILEDCRVKCYKFLREDGATHKYEHDGVMIMSKTIWSISIDVESFLKFADQITDELFLARPIVDLDPAEIVPETRDLEAEARVVKRDPRIATCMTKARLMEAVWAANAFRLRVGEIRYRSVYGGALREYHNRRHRSSVMMMAGMGCETNQYPYARLHYSQEISDFDQRIEWTRSGRIWTKEEVEDLKARFTSRWRDRFGREEDLWNNWQGAVAIPVQYWEGGEEKTTILQGLRYGND